jgi:hypothetical protein
MERHEGASWVIAVLLVVAILGALAEVAANRAVAPTVAPTPPATWETSARVADEALARGDARVARRAYVMALFRARGEGSLPGVVRAAEGLATLGDSAAVANALKMAAPLGAAADAETRVRLQALREARDAPAALPIAVGTAR